MAHAASQTRSKNSVAHLKQASYAGPSVLHLRVKRIILQQLHPSILNAYALTAPRKRAGSGAGTVPAADTT